MNYVIFDLEWNRYAREVKRRCPDEIIQIGAVKADRNLKKMGEFRRLIRPVLYNKIEPTIEDMTGLNYNELAKEGENFNKAMKEFREFMGREPFVMMSWGIQDTVILRNNCKYYNPNMHFDFLKQFVDLQYYASRTQKQTGDFNQLGLATCATRLGIPYDGEDLHDALVDARLTYEVFRHIYEQQPFAECMLDVSDISAKNHPYRATSITDPDSPLIDKTQLRVQCPNCGKYAKKRTPWQAQGKKLIAFHHCNNCGIDLVSSVSATVRLGSDVRLKKKVRVINEGALFAAVQRAKSQPISKTAKQK